MEGGALISLLGQISGINSNRENSSGVGGFTGIGLTPSQSASWFTYSSFTWLDLASQSKIHGKDTELP
jgi:hypothetical protein